MNSAPGGPHRLPRCRDVRQRPENIAGNGVCRNAERAESCFQGLYCVSLTPSCHARLTQPSRKTSISLSITLGTFSSNRYWISCRLHFTRWFCSRNTCLFVRVYQVESLGARPLHESRRFGVYQSIGKRLWTLPTCNDVLCGIMLGESKMHQNASKYSNGMNKDSLSNYIKMIKSYIYQNRSNIKQNDKYSCSPEYLNMVKIIYIKMNQQVPSMLNQHK